MFPMLLFYTTLTFGVLRKDDAKRLLDAKMLHENM